MSLINPNRVTHQQFLQNQSKVEELRQAKRDQEKSIARLSKVATISTNQEIKNRATETVNNLRVGLRMINEKLREVGVE